MITKFSWFPGHMQKTLRKLAEEASLASMVIIVLDARCPRSSRNPELEKIFKNKPVLYVLNKEDLAAVRITRDWLNHFQNSGIKVITLSAKAGTGKKKLLQEIRNEMETRDKKSTKRIKPGIFRVIVVGIPNSGKSSLINMLAPAKSAKTGKKPGLTRGAQWLKIEDNLEVLDSPGVMLPRMDLEDTPWILGAVAAIKQEVIPVEEVAAHLVRFLLEKNLFPKTLIPEEAVKEAQTQFPEDTQRQAETIIEKLALHRGFLDKGGTPSINQASTHILKIFREGTLGKISLESPPAPPEPGQNQEE